MDALLAIYPTARKVEQVLKEQSRARARLGHRVLTFPQLINHLANELPGRSRMISPICERVALGEALGKIGARNSPRASSGLIAHLLRLIRELKSSALTGADFQRAVGELSDPPVGLILLGNAWLEYEKILRDARAMDSRDLERQVLDFLLDCESQARRPRFLFGVRKLLIAEIYDFSLLEFMIAASLIRLIGDADLRIQADSKSINATRFAELTWNRFVDDESIADQVLPEFIRREGRTGRLGLVVRDLFQDRGAWQDGLEENVEVFEAADAKAEIEAVARAIRLNQEGPAADRIELARIAILSRDLTPHRDLIEGICRDYRIPIQLDHPAPAANSLVALAISRLLSVPIDGYQSTALDDLLASSSWFPKARAFRDVISESGYLNAATGKLSACLAEHAANLQLEIEALGKRTLDQEAVNRTSRRLARCTRAQGLLADMMAKLCALDRADSLGDHLTRLEALIDSQAAEPSPHWNNGGEGRGLKWAQSMGEVLRSLEQLRTAAYLFGGLSRLSLRDFRSLVLEAFAQDERSRTGEPSRGAVSVMAVEDARGLDFDLTFIIGLQDGAFPVPHGDDPILPDRIRIQLNSVLASVLRERFGNLTPFARILRTSNEHNSKDRFLFFLAVSTATRQLKLSCASADQKANPLTPSPFLDEVKALIGASNVHRVTSLKTPSAAAECFTRREFLLHLSSTGGLDSPTVATLASGARLESISHRIAIERHRRDYFAIPAREESDEASVVPRKSANQFDGFIGSSGELSAWLSPTGSTARSWSAGALGELACCGFRFFAHRVLRLSRLDERGPEIAAMERGGLIHDVLRELFQRVRDFSNLKTATAAALEMLAAYRRERAPGLADASFGDILWHEIEQTALEVVEFEHRASLQDCRLDRELWLEEAFSMRLRSTGSEIEAFPSGLVLQGRIDRVEIERADGHIIGLRVLDYKNSRSDRYHDVLKKEFAKTDFQLPLYLMAVLERTDGQLSKATQIEAGYLVLKRHHDKLISRSVKRQEIEIDPALRAVPAASGHKSAADRIFQLAASAAQGHFEVDPLKCDRFCDYRAACRYRRPEDLPE